MMREIALHVLDIVQNSITAGASLITVKVTVRQDRDCMRVSVADNGCGMDEAMLLRVVDPFTTSRTTRKVGLGIPMFKAGAEAAGGRFSIRSTPGEGTFIEAEYQITHIDRPPLGDMAQTMLGTVVCHEDIDFVLDYRIDERQFLFDTREIKAALGEGVPLQVPEVMAWLKDYLIEGITELNGGVSL